MVFTNSLSSYYEKFLATGEVKCIDEEIPFEIPKGWEWSKTVKCYRTAIRRKTLFLKSIIRSYIQGNSL